MQGCSDCENLIATFKKQGYWIAYRYKKEGRAPTKDAGLLSCSALAHADEVIAMVESAWQQLRW